MNLTECVEDMIGPVSELLVDWEAEALDENDFELRAARLTETQRGELFRRQRLLAASNRMLDLDIEPDPPPMPGKLDQYEICRIVGRGGMGIVYEALDADLQRKVALKLMASGSAFGRRDERLRQEAHVLAQLKHPNIVPIYAARFQDDRTYFAMEYVAHGTLADHKDRIAAKGTRFVLELFRKIAAAVGEAHRHRILHRDLKPANILLTEDDEPLVADFGLAKIARGLMPTHLPNAFREWTRQGQYPGTPPYMAPEQFDSSFGEVGTHTDVWAMGVMLFEVLLGRRPFEGAGFADFRRRVCDVGYRPGKLVAGAKLDRQTCGLLCRCMAQDPTQRFPNADVFADDLTRLLRLKRRRLQWLAVVASAILLVGVPLLQFVPNVQDRRNAAALANIQALESRVARNETVDWVSTCRSKPSWRIVHGDNTSLCSVDEDGFHVYSSGITLVEILTSIPADDVVIDAEIKHDYSFDPQNGAVGVYHSLELRNCDQRRIAVADLFAVSGPRGSQDTTVTFSSRAYAILPESPNPIRARSYYPHYLKSNMLLKGTANQPGGLSFILTANSNESSSASCGSVTFPSLNAVCRMDATKKLFEFNKDLQGLSFVTTSKSAVGLFVRAGRMTVKRLVLTKRAGS